MKHALCLLMFLAAAAYAEQMKWDDLCSSAGFRHVSVKMIDGRKVSGRCVSVTDSAISINTGWGVPKLKRGDVVSARIDKKRTSHCLANAIRLAGESVFLGFYALASPEFFLAPFFFVASPAVLAGGTPFCAVYDLINRLTIGGSEKITII